MALALSPKTRVEIADRVVDGQVLGIVLEDLLVLSNGVLQLALLDKLFRGAENLLFVEAKTKRHRGADSSLFPPNAAISASVAERVRTSPGDSQTKPRKPRNRDSRSNVIVRPGTASPMVTDDYRALPKGSVRPVSGQPARIQSEISKLLPLASAFCVPSLPNISQKLCFIRFHQRHQRLISSVFMSRRPKHHLRQHRRKIHPLCRE